MTHGQPCNECVFIDPNIKAFQGFAGIGVHLIVTKRLQFWPKMWLMKLGSEPHDSA